MGHGLPSRCMRLSAFTPSIGGRPSTLASLSPGVPRPFHANVTLVHRHRSSASSASLASSASPSSATNSAAATRKNALQRDMRAGHAIRAIKIAQARTHTRMHARTHARTHTHTHTQNSLVLQCRRLSRGRQPSDVELGARRTVRGRSGVGACKCMIVCVCARERVCVCVCRCVRASVYVCVCRCACVFVRACCVLASLCVYLCLCLSAYLALSPHTQQASPRRCLTHTHTGVRVCTRA